MNWKTLLWWLGPWCNQEKSPKSITTEERMVRLDNHSFRFRMYSGSVRQGAVLGFTGLHPDGLEDRRVDRFCRVLAGSGAIVGVPELPTMTQSVMVPKLLEDTEAAVELFASYLSDVGQENFGVFCISASSIAGLHLVTHPTWSSRVSKIAFVWWICRLDGISPFCHDWSYCRRVSSRTDRCGPSVIASGLHEFDAYVFPQIFVLNTTLQSRCSNVYINMSVRVGRNQL